jgi:archaetidylinositol phosphate synthase
MSPVPTGRSIRPASHVRHHGSLLAGLEKRLLVWIAGRLPARVSSDHLSLLGLLAMAAAALALAAVPHSPWAASVAAIVALAANWFGDSMDGTLARVRNQQRPRYGYYVDHLIDLAGTTMLLAGLAASGLMTPMLALLLLSAYLLVSAETYLAVHVSGVFRLSFAGWGPTELRILLATGILVAIWKPAVQIGVFGTQRLFDLGGIAAVIGLAGVFLVNGARQARRLYLAEPLPARREEAA